jgi:adenylate cyclase
MGFGRLSFATLTTLSFIAIGLVWGGILGAMQIAGVASPLDRIEYLTLDWRFLAVGPRTPPRGVIVVAIDDETIKKAGGYPLPRGGVAQIIRRIAALDPQAIAVDIAFLDAREPGQDSQLADALQSTKPVLAAIGLFDRNDSTLSKANSRDIDLIPRPSGILWPIGILHGEKAGLANISTDTSGIPRFVPLLYRYDDKFVLSFALAAAALALNSEPAVAAEQIKLAGRVVRTDLGYQMAMRYYGPRGSFPQISAAKFLDGDVDADLVRGQTVLLGVTVTGGGDVYATPFDRATAGVEIFATAVSNLLASDALVRTRMLRWIDAVVTCFLPCVSILLLSMRRIYVGLSLAVFFIAAWLALTVAAFAEGYWLNIAGPMAALIPLTLGYGGARWTLDHFVAGRLSLDRATLLSFQSPLVFLEKPREQEIAVVFLDLSGFTGLSEQVGPQPTRDLLAAFQALIERETMKHAGVVVDFMGDGAMIVFGLPTPREDDASRALLAILDLRNSTDEWLRSLPPVAQTRLSLRIGGHFGPAVVSRLGARRHQHITATGDTVNVASRLLEAAKELKCVIVVGEKLVLAARLSTWPAQAISAETYEINIRGRSQTMRVRTGT